MPEFDPWRQLNINEALNLLQPAMIFTVGVAIYAVLIFNLYRFMSRKDIFNLDFSKYEESKHPVLAKTLDFIFYVAKYLLIFPLFAFFWFGVLVVMVAFLSKTKEVDDLLLIAMAVLTSVRVTSYYTEELSRDIAKMLPFALLGIFLIDLRYFDLSTSTELLNRVGDEWESIFYYWVFVVALELVLRVTEPYLKALYNSLKSPGRRSRGQRATSESHEPEERDPVELPVPAGGRTERPEERTRVARSARAGQEAD